MVTKRIRSEYMKKFKDPKWETYSRCYEDRLNYRLTRRMLEQTHNPWFWSGSDSDSDSAARSPPSPCESRRVHRCKGHDATVQPQEEREEHGVPAVPRTDVVRDGRATSRGGEPVPAIQGEQNQVLRDTGQQEPQQVKPSKPTGRSRRVRPETSQKAREDSKERRHSFALYGAGEKNADIGAKKTHNVGPAASTNEIHESALRAKTRRQVERRAKSMELDKDRKPTQPAFNPWLSEYMRCFPARSQ